MKYFWYSKYVICLICVLLHVLFSVAPLPLTLQPISSTLPRNFLNSSYQSVVVISNEEFSLKLLRLD